MSVLRQAIRPLCSRTRSAVRHRALWTATSFPSSSSSSSSSNVISLTKQVKQARAVDINSIGSVLAPFVERTHLTLPVDKPPTLSPREYFKVGGAVQATVLKTHSLGVLMKIPPQRPQSESVSTPPASEDAGAGELDEVETEGEGFIALLPHLEVDFYRKSAGRDLRLDETYSLYVQSLTETLAPAPSDASFGESFGVQSGLRRQGGLIRLSFRPGVRDRLQQGKEAVLEALAATNGRLPVGEASSAEEIGRVFFGLSKSDFKRAVGALYKEHRVERPAGRVFTQQTSEETRRALLAAEEAVQHQMVTVTLRNLPEGIRKASLARHVMAQVHRVMHSTSNSNSERLSLKGIDVSIQNLSLHGGQNKRTSRKRDSSSVAELCLRVSGTASRLEELAKTLQVCGGSAEVSGSGLTVLANRLLRGLDIGKRVTVQA